MQINPQIFEAIMIGCFGSAWPFSIIRLLRVKSARGKSFFFLGIILTGYISGIFFNISRGANLVLLLYVFNAVMVSVDLLLCIKYTRDAKRKYASV